MTKQQRDVLHLALRLLGKSTRQTYAYNIDRAHDQIHGVIRCAIWSETDIPELRKVEKTIANLFVSQSRIFE